MPDGSVAPPRCAALVGPYLSGKTTLVDAMLFAAGAINRKGTIKEGNTVGDSSPESRGREMSTELNAAHMAYLGDRWALLDCPGSVEFRRESFSALTVADIVVVVCEPEVGKALALAPIFKLLDHFDIPHMVFINKMDHAESRVVDLMAAIQAVSERPLVLRHVPIREGEAVTGYIDLISERAYGYDAGKASKLVQIPDAMADREQTARQDLLESLADFDDTLLEQLLEDVVPPKAEIYQHLSKALEDDKVVPVMLGAAEQMAGVERLLKALRHDVPGPAATAARLGIEAGDTTLATCIKTYHLPHTGKLNLMRIWNGVIADGDTLNDTRVSGLFHMQGHALDKIAKAGAGEVVGCGRMEGIKTGDHLTPSGEAPSGIASPPEQSVPVYALAIEAENRSDEVKLSESMAKLIEEDPSLEIEHNPDTHESVLWGQGEMHLQIAMARLNSKYNLAMTTRRPQVPYKETIRKSVSQHARHKKQSGGHGQYGDVHVEIKPRQRGAGFVFTNSIVGGAVPKQYIPSVENGVKEYMVRGPLGFPVVDVSVELTDGKFHAVDSSDMAFKAAARMAMSEGMPLAGPVLLEPILDVTLSAPAEFTANVQRIITGRRGRILGFGAKPDWNGWDEVQANMPQSEVFDMIIDLRSLSQGVGTFTWAFDHLQELTGREADQVLEARKEQLAN